MRTLMETIEFESLTLNDKGEIITRTRHQAEQITEDPGKAVALAMLIGPSGIFQMGSARHPGHADEFMGFRLVCVRLA